MQDGQSLDQTKTTKALEAKGLRVTSFSQSDIPVPKAGYVLAVAGTG
ncbi:MAG: hypothetical protein KJO21_05400 [Verrucomicrobiae bacterium]|nr:hypothetical protein [Verrucomicrobiae bacterium]NNJ43157.1 hypothetical protein [Akkermansiaceae bacterium]